MWCSTVLTMDRKKMHLSVSSPRPCQRCVGVIQYPPSYQSSSPWSNAEAKKDKWMSSLACGHSVCLKTDLRFLSLCESKRSSKFKLSNLSLTALGALSPSVMLMRTLGTGFIFGAHFGGGVWVHILLSYSCKVHFFFLAPAHSWEKPMGCEVIVLFFQGHSATVQLNSFKFAT